MCKKSYFAMNKTDPFLKPNIINPEAIDGFTDKIFKQENPGELLRADHIPEEDIPHWLAVIRGRFRSLINQFSKRNPVLISTGFRDFREANALFIRQQQKRYPKLAEQFNDAGQAFHVFFPSSFFRRDAALMLFWLTQSVLNGEEWIFNDGQFAKKISFVPQKDKTRMQVARDAMDADLKKWGVYHLFYEREGQFKIAYDYGDGWVVVDMLTHAEMGRETKRSGVCVGDPKQNHIRHLTQGTARYLSLRDPHNDTHVTIQLSDKDIVTEIKGKQNRPIDSKYEDRLLEFLQNCKSVWRVETGPQTGIFTHENKYYTYRRVPERRIFKTLDLSLWDDVVLPQKMTVDELILNGKCPPHIPAGVAFKKIVLQWKEKSGYVFSRHRTDGPAEIVFSSRKNVIAASDYHQGGQTKKYEGDELKKFASALLFENDRVHGILAWLPARLKL